MRKIYVCPDITLLGEEHNVLILFSEKNFLVRRGPISESDRWVVGKMILFRYKKNSKLYYAEVIRRRMYTESFGSRLIVTPYLHSGEIIETSKLNFDKNFEVVAEANKIPLAL